MKRFLIVPTIVLLTLILAACGPAATVSEEIPVESPAEYSGEVESTDEAAFDSEPSFSTHLTTRTTKIFCVQGGQIVHNTETNQDGVRLERYFAAGTYIAAYVWTDGGGKQVFPVGEYGSGASCSYTLLPR